MSVYDIGRVCVKLMGREAGCFAVVLNVIDRNFVLVDGPKVRRRRCNIRHLEPTMDRLDLEKDADLKALTAAAKKAKLTKKLESVVEIAP